MAKYANIVSFNDVKAASRLRFAQEGAEFGWNYYDLDRFADRGASDEDAESAGRAGHRTRFAELPSKPEEVSPKHTARRGQSQRPSRNRSRAQEPAAQVRRGKSASEDANRKREERRRERTKARAEKMFAEQFEDDRSYAAQDDTAPRAALYEGQMGATHRRAARMQLASEAAPVTAKLNPAGWFSNLNINQRRLRVVTAMLCLVLAAVFLYTPAQHYYQATREHDRLVAEYASIQERNAALGTQNASLASNAGMEDAVRQKYGFVVEGDETAVVSGLSDEALSNHGDGIEANVLSSSVKAPEEWYTPYLDALFGVS